MREGLRFGIIMVITALNQGLVRYRTEINFKSALTLALIDDSEYRNIVGRTEGLTPGDTLGRGLIKKQYAIEVQIANHCYDKLDFESIQSAINDRYNRDGIKAVEKVPELEERVDLHQLNQGHNFEALETELVIGREFSSLQKATINLGQNFITMILGTRDSAIYDVMKAWIKSMHQMPYYQEAMYYYIDNRNMDLYSLSEFDNCIDITGEDDFYDVKDHVLEILKQRREALREARVAKSDITNLVNQWNPIVFVIADHSKFADGDDYLKVSFIEECLKEFRYVKTQFFIMDTYSDLASSYSDASKIIKEEQNGLLLGSMHEQSIFNVKFPYSAKEKLERPYDGYFVQGSKYVSMRFAI